MNSGNNIFSNPQFLAGLAMIRGVPAHEAYANAALQTQQMQQAQLAQQNAQRQQFALQALPQIAGKLYNAAPAEAFQELVNIGIDPKEAVILIDAIQKQNMPQTFKGPNNVEYSKSFNRETGEWQAKPLTGQNNTNGQQLSNAEIKINADKIASLNADAGYSNEELRLIKNSENAFKEFDENTGNYTGPGTLASKLVPDKADNLIYNSNAQKAKQTIDKLTSRLLENRNKAAKGSESDFRTEQKLKGLPSIGLNPEARKDLIRELKEQNYIRILKSKFFDEWYKNNNKDLSGAEDAFIQFINSQDVVDKEGNLNKNLLNQIKQKTQPNQNINFANETNNVDLQSLADSVSIEEIQAALKGK